MSNHYHLVLKVCPEQLADLSEDEIMDRCCALFKGPLLVQNYRSGEHFEAIRTIGRFGHRQRLADKAFQY